MSKQDDFASLMESTFAQGRSRSQRRLTPGESVEGVVIQISADSIFVDVGTARDARIDRLELEDKSGKLSVKLGDKLRATVVRASASEPAELTLGVGRGGSVDSRLLEAALTSGAPVSGVVSRAVTAGLEVEIVGVRAFCPASQVELNFVSDLAPYVGQTLEFKLLELKEGGRSAIVSRRALLEQQRAERAKELEQSLSVGSDVEANVISVQKYGALVDLGGIDGLIHISELAHHRVDRVEDVLSVGERVTVRVLSLEHEKKQLRVRLSLKALADKPESPTAQKEEVLEGTVSQISSFGVFVTTPKGEGLVPLRELALSPGADHRRSYPVGKTMQVVVVGSDPKSGKLRFSVSGVDRVVERNNFRDYRKDNTQSGGSLGSLGDLLKARFGLQAGGGAGGAQAQNPPPKNKPAKSSAAEAEEKAAKDEPVVFQGGVSVQGVVSENNAQATFERPRPNTPKGGKRGAPPDGVIRRRR